MSDPLLEWIRSCRLAVDHQTRRGFRDDCKQLVDDAWLKLLALLDERYQQKKPKK
jgi:hypothetical protein